jgi:hypothetical protein
MLGFHILIRKLMLVVHFAHLRTIDPSQKRPYSTQFEEVTVTVVEEVLSLMESAEQWFEGIYKGLLSVGSARRDGPPARSQGGFGEASSTSSTVLPCPSSQFPAQWSYQYNLHTVNTNFNHIWGTLTYTYKHGYTMCSTHIAGPKLRPAVLYIGPLGSILYRWYWYCNERPIGALVL